MIAIILLCVLVVDAQLCPQFFIQETKSPIPNRWYGSITILSENGLNGVWLKMKFDRKVQQLGSWFGEVYPKNDDHLEFLIKDHKFRLKANHPEVVRFYVQYDRSGPVPNLVSFRLNGKQVCPEAKPLYGTMSSINDEVCGTVIVQATPLITYGYQLNEGAYPWHVAIYHNKSSYICGGSLVTKSYVVTAGHCVFKKYKQQVSTDEITVHLGKHYFVQGLNTKVQERSVSLIKLHPSYNATNYKNDIALLKLATPADINDFVRHICLWQNTVETTNEGTVVEWGLDETGKLSQTLMQTTMPIVSQESCIFSNPDFYSRFTSENTFCAGHRNGTSACNGDSGGGMAVHSNQKWYLRGIVSLAVPLQNYTCDSFNYVIFTDIIRYMDWVKVSIEDG